MSENGARHDIEKRWAEWSQMIDEVAGWYLHAELKQVTITRKKNGWRMRLQVRQKNKDVVCWVDAQSYYLCWAMLGAAIKHQQIRWYPDKYPPNMGD